MRDTAKTGEGYEPQSEGSESVYCAILRLLDQAFNGSPRTLKTAIGAMCRLKVQAHHLTIGSGVSGWAHMIPMSDEVVAQLARVLVKDVSIVDRLVSQLASVAGRGIAFILAAECDHRQTPSRRQRPALRPGNRDLPR